MYSFATRLAANFARRFGNFIGEEADASEEDSQHGANAGNYVYDDEYVEDEEDAGQDLMEVDGEYTARAAFFTP